MDVSKETMSVEVVYAASAKQQTMLTVEVLPHTTVLEAIHASNILVQHPEIGDLVGKVGIFSTLVDLNRPLKAGDRIEIYRTLFEDPKEARRRKAKEALKNLKK